METYKVNEINNVLSRVKSNPLKRRDYNKVRHDPFDYEFS